MPTIFDYVTSKEIATFYTNSPYNEIQYLGETLFPAKKQLGLDLAWIKGSQGLPVALRPSAFDAKATLRDRIGFGKVETEMPFFREAMRIGEKDRQEMNKFAAATNVEMIKPILNNIYNDAAQLVEGAKVQTERMRMQLLSTGKINIADNRMAYEYDYKHKAGQKATLTNADKWTDPTADVLAQIQTWQDKVEEDTGVRPTRLVMSRKTFNYLLKNNQIKAITQPLADASKVFLTDALVKAALSQFLGVTIAIYNKKFKDETGAAKLYFPDDVVTLIPEGTLGSTYYGTTPEESDLMSGNTDAQVAIVNTGIAVTTIKEPHPVNVETIVSGIFLPSFETIDNIFIAKVA